MKKASVLIRIVSLSIIIIGSSCSWIDADHTDNPRSAAARGDCHIQLDCLDAFTAGRFPMGSNSDSIEKTVVRVQGIQKESIYMQAPGVAEYDVFILPGTQFSSWVTMAPTAWSGSTDGAVFSVIVIGHDPPESVVVWKRLIDPKNNPMDRQWHRILVPLGCWTGKRCTIRMHTDPGHANDTTKDWCLWGEPLIISDPLSKDYTQVDLLETQLNRGEYRYDHDFLATSTIPAGILSPDISDTARTTAFTLNGETREGLYAHPPWSMTRTIIPGARSIFIASLGMIESCWKSSDGVIFQVEISSHRIPPTVVFEYFLNPGRNRVDQQWVDIRVDLSAYVGSTIDVTLRTTSGYRDDLKCDSVAWARPAVISID